MLGLLRTTPQTSVSSLSTESQIQIRLMKCYICCLLSRSKDAISSHRTPSVHWYCLAPQACRFKLCLYQIMVVCQLHRRTVSCVSVFLCTHAIHYTKTFNVTLGLCHKRATFTNQQLSLTTAWPITKYATFVHAAGDFHYIDTTERVPFAKYTQICSRLLHLNKHTQFPWLIVMSISSYHIQELKPKC